MQKYLTYFHFNDPVLSGMAYIDSGWTKESNLLQSSTSIIKSIIKFPSASMYIKIYYNGLWSPLCFITEIKFSKIIAKNYNYFQITFLCIR